MKDFYYLVKDALEQDTIDDFIKEWSADPNIVLSISSKPIKISEKAFYKLGNGYNSLEHIFLRSKKLHREIAYAGIISDDHTINHFIKGRIGTNGLCDWESGTLLSNSYKIARELELKVSLGHTHPKGYGAICSKIYWDKKDLQGFNDENSKIMLKTGIYERFGGDYAEMLVRKENNPLVSDIFSIMSPRENQIGFFEIKDKGRVVYHPWEIVE